MMENSQLDWKEIEALIEEVVEHQKKKVLSCGRRLVPTLTPEDVLQPNDYPALDNHPHFRYEEGMLAGLQTLQMALWALKKRSN